MVREQLRVYKRCWNRAAENPDALGWRREWQGWSSTHSGSWWDAGVLSVLMSRVMLRKGASPPGSAPAAITTHLPGILVRPE